MKNRIARNRVAAIDSNGAAREAKFRALAKNFPSFFKAPKAVIAKCHLKALNRAPDEAIKPTNRRAVNPLMIRGLHIS